ncbi:hypothetical protein [Listeria costaricensis]|uniref:hypothetical protein n=1 Tax=Listeria costaricensis TaxID=2026604 RepID=UPI0013C48C05|nr:hypothetical protein [Listeria costaricensis]
MLDLNSAFFTDNLDVLLKFDSDTHLAIIGLTDMSIYHKTYQEVEQYRINKDAIISYFEQKDAPCKDELKDFSETYLVNYYSVSF